MKKSTKIFSILLVSLITLMSVVCITSFATESDTLEVTLVKNISVSDKIQAMYAVKVENGITAENTTLTVYDADPSLDGANVVWTGNGETREMEQFNNDSYIVFYTNRVALYEMAETFYIEVESDGKKSAVETYSVAEYLFDRLYKDDFVNKTEVDGEDYSRKLFYEGLIQTGGAAHTVITNTVEKSIDDLAYVYVNGATLADGSVKAIVNKGETVTLGTLPNAKSWSITSYVNGASETIETKDSTLVLEGCAVITVVSDVGKGEYYNNTAYSSDAKYNYDGLAPEIKKASSDLMTSDSESGRVSVEDDALSVYTRKFGLVNGGAKTGATYVFETDLYMDSDTVTATNGTIGWIGMSAGASNKTAHFASFAIMYKATDGNITRLYISDAAAVGTVCVDLELETWQNLRIEYTPNSDNTGTVRFYLNGELTKEYVTNGYGGNAANANTSFECFGIESRADTSSGGYGGYIRLDNTFMSAVTNN